MTKNGAMNGTTSVTWTLDDEGRLTARWNAPPARVSRAAALAAYFRLRALGARRQPT